MAATITLSWFTPENMYIAHVGDSRLYLHRDGETTQITNDHNFIWKKFNKGELSEFQYRMHPRRCILHEVVGGGHRWFAGGIMASRSAASSRELFADYYSQ